MDLDDFPPPQPVRRIGVHVIAEAAFCPRAGVLTWQLRGADDGESFEDGSPRLDWLPDYDEALIHEALVLHWNDVNMVLKWSGGWLLLCIAVLWTLERGLGIAMLLPLVLVAGWLWPRFQAIAELERRRRLALESKGYDLDYLEHLSRHETVINWWQLRKSGLDVVKPRDPLIDPDAGLAGRPFLILQHLGLRIPVFRKHAGKPELRPQHRIRIAAYCRLIEKTERGSRSPFGIVVFAGSYDVVLVPNSPNNQTLLHEAFAATRSLLDEFESGMRVPPPDDGRCSGCHLGYPRLHKPGSDGHLVPLGCKLSLRRGVDGQYYHSRCGDRFGWAPPHDRAAEKKLV